MLRSRRTPWEYITREHLMSDIELCKRHETIWPERGDCSFEKESMRKQEGKAYKGVRSSLRAYH